MIGLMLNSIVVSLGSRSIIMQSVDNIIGCSHCSPQDRLKVSSAICIMTGVEGDLLVRSILYLC